MFSFQLSFSELAFESLCEKYHADFQAGQMRFQITRNTDETARMIANGNGDTAILMCLKKLLDPYRRKMTQLSLETVTLCDCPMELTCKKGHPILQNGKVHPNLLSQYPGFSGVPRSSLEPYLSFFDAGLIGRTATTYIMDPGPMRYRLLHKTGGFMFSLPLSDEIRETYDLESVTLKSMELTVFAVYRRNSAKEPLIREYLQLCKSLC